MLHLFKIFSAVLTERTIKANTNAVSSNASKYIQQTNKVIQNSQLDEG